MRPLFPLLSVYTDAEIEECFSEASLVESWLEVERGLAAVEATLGIIPVDAGTAIVREVVASKVNFADLSRRMRQIGYPIVPLIEQIAASCSPIVADYVHWGATTQDIMDTGLVLQIRLALMRIETLVWELGNDLAALAQEHKLTPMAARTHSQQAVPTTFGAKVAVWLDEFSRHYQRLTGAHERVLVVQLFGAGGTAAALGPLSHKVRHGLARHLGLTPTDVPWHTARDQLAELAFQLAATASTCGKVAREIVELSRTEIAELREDDAFGHGASSTMPQKMNPILCEVVIGMSALAREAMPSMLAAMQPTHERASGEWQIEWDALPRLFTLAGSCLANIRVVIQRMSVFPQRMNTNLDLDNGLVMAEAMMMILAPQLGRLQAHHAVSNASRQAREQHRPLHDVLSELLDPGVLRALPPLIEVARPDQYLGEAERIVGSAVQSWRERFGQFPPTLWRGAQ